MWIDSGSPISILTIGSLCKRLDATGINLEEVTPVVQDFRDYQNNSTHLLGTMKLELVSNGWETSGFNNVIERT